MCVGGVCVDGLKLGRELDEFLVLGTHQISVFDRVCTWYMGVNSKLCRFAE